MYDPIRGSRCHTLLVCETLFCLYRRPQTESSLPSSVNSYAPTRQPLSAAKANSYMKLHIYWSDLDLRIWGFYAAK
jgi:hypothetical protein